MMMATDRGLVHKTGVPTDCYGSGIAIFLQAMDFFFFYLVSYL
jgi:hypothetical protein